MAVQTKMMEKLAGGVDISIGTATAYQAFVNTTNIGTASGTGTGTDVQKAAFLGWAGVAIQDFDAFFNIHLNGF